jgi:alkyldihydroxyacetonephosphate synthase
MRRWNGWGDDTVTYPVSNKMTQYLETHLGKTPLPQDITLEKLVKQVPTSGLPDHPTINKDETERIRHARGQSFPDWLAYRTGKISTFPDGVAYPPTETDVQDLIRFAVKSGIRLIPYGGGTSVVGHINPLASDVPSLTVDLSRLNQQEELDERAHLATFGAGISGPDLEAKLRAQGFTLGHYPQSFEYSTLGGWIATRSSGQQSLYYGRIENLFIGGKMETPVGTVEIPTFPASAAGPNIKEIVLGSEGRMGIITQATVRISPQPETDSFHALFFPNFESGMNAARQMVQARLPLSMVRLSNERETETMLTLAGHESAQKIIQRLLATRGITHQKCMLMIGYTGNILLGKATLRTARSIAIRQGGVYLPYIAGVMGSQWKKSRFRNPYLRNTLWEQGYAIDTLETATEWSNTIPLMQAIETAIRTTGETFNEKVQVFTHLSHVYPSGSSIYTTYLFRITPDADEMLERWKKLKHAASQAIVDHHATISHQHGVGIDHLPYLKAEKGELGIQALKQLCSLFDPQGIMNIGKLIE